MANKKNLLRYAQRRNILTIYQRLLEKDVVLLNILWKFSVSTVYFKPNYNNTEPIIK